MEAEVVAGAVKFHVPKILTFFYAVGNTKSETVYI